MSTDKGMTETKPSPGALRAAEKIVDTINLEPTEHKEELRSLTVEILANTIDREMNTEPRSAGAPDLLAALEYVQHALACWRDNEPMPAYEQYAKGELDLEEVKYCIVDPIIAKAKGESQ